jgi:hypothetical protein
MVIEANIVMRKKRKYKKRKPVNYWTKEKCIEDARKYKKRSEWMRKSHGAYRSAKKNGCFEECCAHMITKRKK